ncbi:MAG: hypothetical protein VX712_07605 [Bacteroidota bacterium]|uniref:Uncharacterized protein n=1 Tax=Christiangramia flava JLT2011 TaxID=1229726 RepID=A0A1L7I4G6_9FLAO|nr:hypothetical protein [Christiangramia flava]APU68005.1 hypothetical protein GRFL_1281 [Christiangramia flava JLT2011]MEE2772066.1 hypothetical protein [Bacteroidota bacterium]OSS40506.1 hypothetical protein C723_0814 [Christiangramia flava JLT2011]
MELLQQILVLITFLIALGYLITRFVGKPAFLGGKKKATGSCGVASDCKCGD